MTMRRYRALCTCHSATLFMSPIRRSSARYRARVFRPSLKRARRKMTSRIFRFSISSILDDRRDVAAKRRSSVGIFRQIHSGTRDMISYANHALTPRETAQHALGNRRLQKTSFLQTLAEAQTGPLPDQNLRLISALASEHKSCARMKMGTQNPARLGSKSVKASSHINGFCAR